jgi:hypothetical protein
MTETQNLVAAPKETGLNKYEAACRALAEAKAIDEVKDIRDRATAKRIYAKQARNRQLEADAFEIRMRAEKRVGEMMAAQKEAFGTAQGKRSDLGLEKTQVETPTLAEAGIDKNLANRARKLGALSEEEFKETVAEGRKQIIAKTAKVIGDLIKTPPSAKARPSAPPLTPESWAKATPDQRKKFVETIRPSMLVAALGTRAFFHGLTKDQRNDMAGYWAEGVKELREAARGRLG